MTRITRTFLLTDIEGSTRMLQSQPEAMLRAVELHDALVAQVVAGAGGTLVKSRGEGDSTFSVFENPSDALRAGLDLHRMLAGQTWPEGLVVKVRASVHTGEVEARDGDFFGLTLSRAARIRASARGGMTLVSHATAALVQGRPPNGRLVDLGHHRLPDLMPSLQLFALIGDDDPEPDVPIRTLDSVSHNLPVALTGFIGREELLSQLGDWIERRRLITLTGPGGSGKTRLALQFAAEQSHRRAAGSWFVDLTTIDADEAVRGAIAGALGRPDFAQVVDGLRQAEAILILDNAEHVLTGSREVVRELTQACPGVVLLVTSRERLRLEGEQVVTVGPLTLPEHEDAVSTEDSEAVRLFVERARAADSRFVLDARNVGDVGHLCQMLEGIPLAIEQAASFASFMTAGQIARQLGPQLLDLRTTAVDLDRRHQTMRATIAWSVRLLGPEERDAFAHLSVFRGGWTLASAQEVLPEGTSHFETLRRLVESSLVVSDADPTDARRFRYLRPVREFAAELLDDPTRDALGQRVVAWVSRSAMSIIEPEALREWFDAEYPNVTAALDFAIRTTPETFVGLVFLLRRCWYYSGRLDEGMRWLLPAAELETDPARRARLLAVIGSIHQRRLQFEDALAAYRDSFHLLESVGDRSTAAVMRTNLGVVAFDSGDFASASDALEGALVTFIESNDRLNEHFVRANLGPLAVERGDHRRGEAELELAIACFQQERLTLWEAGAVANRANLRAAQGRGYEAALDLDRAFRLWTQAPDPIPVANALIQVAELALERGDTMQADIALDTALGVFRAMGASPKRFHQVRVENLRAALKKPALPVAAVEPQDAIVIGLHVLARLGDSRS